MDYQLIKALARERNISIESLAESIDMSRTGLNATLKNGTLKVDALEKIANVLGVSPIVFFSGQNFESIRSLISRGLLLSLEQYMKRLIFERTLGPQYIFDLWENTIPEKKRKEHILKSISGQEENHTPDGVLYVETMDRLAYVLNYFTDPANEIDIDRFEKTLGFAWKDFLGGIRRDDDIKFLFDEGIYNDVDFIEDARSAFQYCFGWMPKDWHQQLKDTLMLLKKKG